MPRHRASRWKGSSPGRTPYTPRSRRKPDVDRPTPTGRTIPLFGAAQDPGGHPRADTEAERGGQRREGGRQGEAPAVQDAGEDVPPKGVGPKRVFHGGRGQADRRALFQRVEGRDEVRTDDGQDEKREQRNPGPERIRHGLRPPHFRIPSVPAASGRDRCKRCPPPD